MDEHDYWQDEITRLEIEEMRKHCPPCFYWDDYYLCLTGDYIYENI